MNRYNINDVTNSSSPFYYKNIEKTKLMAMLKASAKKSFNAYKSVTYFPLNNSEFSGMSFMMAIPNKKRGRGHLFITFDVPAEFAIDKNFNKDKIVKSISDTFDKYLKSEWNKWEKNDKYYQDSISKFLKNL